MDIPISSITIGFPTSGMGAFSSGLWSYTTVGSTGVLVPNYNLVEATAGSVGIVLTLPPASNMMFPIKIIKVDPGAGVVLIQSPATTTINGSTAGYSLGTQWQSVEIAPAGAFNYVISGTSTF